MKLIDQLWNECKNQLTIDELDRLCLCGFVEKGEVETLIFQQLKNANLSAKDLLARLESLQILQKNPMLLDMLGQDNDNPLFTEYYNFSFSELFRRMGLSPIPYLWQKIIFQKFNSPQLAKATNRELVKLYEWKEMPWEDKERIEEIIQSRIPKLDSEGLSPKELLQKQLKMYLTFPFLGGNILEGLGKLEDADDLLFGMFQDHSIPPGIYLLFLFRDKKTVFPLCRGDLYLRKSRNVFSPFYPHLEYWESWEKYGYDYSPHEWLRYFPYSFEELTDSEIRKGFLDGDLQFIAPFFELQNNFLRHNIWEWYPRLKDEAFSLDLQRDQIKGIYSGNIPPERFSFGLIEDNFVLRKIAEAGLFDSLPWTWSFFYSRGWDNTGEYNPFISREERERLSKEWYWLEFCILYRPEMQDKNIKSFAQIEEICGKCPFKDLCHESEKLRFPFNLNFLYKLPDHLNYEDSGKYSLEDWESERWDDSPEYYEDERDEEYDRSFFEDYYHPGKRFGRRHHRGGGKAHKVHKTELELPELEKKVLTAFKKWDRELEPLVQTVAFITNHVISAQGRDVSTWQTAANWLFEVKEKKLSAAVANLDSAQIIKLTQFCSRLPWPKMKELLSEPIDLCRGDYVTTFNELIHGTDEPLSEDAEELLQNELFAQVYRLARGWAKIC